MQSQQKKWKITLEYETFYRKCNLLRFGTISPENEMLLAPNNQRICSGGTWMLGALGRRQTLEKGWNMPHLFTFLGQRRNSKVINMKNPTAFGQVSNELTLLIPPSTEILVFQFWAVQVFFSVMKWVHFPLTTLQQVFLSISLLLYPFGIKTHAVHNQDYFFWTEVVVSKRNIYIFYSGHESYIFIHQWTNWKLCMQLRTLTNIMQMNQIYNGKQLEQAWSVIQLMLAG